MAMYRSSPASSKAIQEKIPNPKTSSGALALHKTTLMKDAVPSRMNFREGQLPICYPYSKNACLHKKNGDDTRKGRLENECENLSAPYLGVRWV